VVLGWLYVITVAKMWIKLNDAIWASKLDYTCKLTALAIATFINEDQEHKWCWASELTIAGMCSTSERTVRTAVKRMESLGILKIEKRLTKNSKWLVNHYAFRKELFNYRQDLPAVKPAGGKLCKEDRQSTTVPPAKSADESSNNHPVTIKSDGSL
jgi:hypothetical protein